MIGLASILACLFVTLQIMRRVARPIERLTQDALRIAAGDHRPPAVTNSPREASALRDALDRLNSHVAGALDGLEIEAERHRIAASERLLLDEAGDSERAVILADDGARRLIWIATSAPGLASALAARAMAGLRDRIIARPDLLDHAETLADTDHGVCLSFAPAARLLCLIADAPMTVEMNGVAITLVPGEAVGIPAGVARLYRENIAIDLESGASQ